MNWLAHVFLSGQDVEFRLGNLFADVVRGEQRAAMSEAFRRGAQRHHAIDAFTDAHPLVRRSRARIGPKQRRFSGVLVDVFYDHLLASRWHEYSSVPLADFTARFYRELGACAIDLPEPARTLVDRIARHDLLDSYRHIHGVEQSLRRLSLRLAVRWRKPFALEEAIGDLLAHEAGFAADFAEFFPALRAHVDRLDP